VQSIEEVGRDLEARVPAMQRLTNAIYDAWLAEVGIAAA